MVITLFHNNKAKPGALLCTVATVSSPGATASEKTGTQIQTSAVPYENLAEGKTHSQKTGLVLNKTTVIILILQ